MSPASCRRCQLTFLGADAILKGRLGMSLRLVRAVCARPVWNSNNRRRSPPPAARQLPILTTALAPLVRPSGART